MGSGCCFKSRAFLLSGFIFKILLTAEALTAGDFNSGPEPVCAGGAAAVFCFSGPSLAAFRFRDAVRFLAGDGIRL
jgi:hypothetical protein